MPPSGNPPPSNEGQSTTENEKPYYSNEDVAILHDIVVLAQELLPNLPERERLPTNALFNAYNDILPRLGINVDHDNRYARILFKIGGLRGQGTLFERFEDILSKMGIEIEFENDDEEDEEDSQLDDSAADMENATVGTTPPQDNTIESRGRPRRNSESSRWDLEGEAPPKIREKRRSFSSIREIEKGAGHPHLLEEIQRTRPSAPDPEHADRMPDEALHPRVGAWLNSRQNAPRRRRGRSVSTHGSMRIRRRPGSLTHGPRKSHTSADNPTSDDYQATTEFTAVTSENEEVRPQGLRIVQDSASLMQIKAGLILQDHLSFLAKSQIRQWRDKAIRLREHRQNLDRIATNHDRNIVLQLVLALWQTKWIENRQARRTERFYAHLERRATRARDLYLMLKVLQHWSDNTREQVDRTNAARRHILRTRYFNAWADITAVNELKVRRHVLKKFFGTWKNRHITTANDDATAIQKYEENLVEKSYRKWFYKLWEAKANAWWAEKMKRRVMFRWIVVYHNTWEDHRIAEEERREQLIWKAWRIWRNKTVERIRQREEAELIYQGRICRNTIRKWRRETQVVPAKTMVQSDVKYRIVRDTFGVWLHRARQEIHAANTDRGRILREALVTWRHKVRIQLLQKEVDKRIARQTVYKWFIAQRLSTFRSQEQEKLLRRIVQVWAQRWQDMREDRWQQEDIAQAYATQKIQNSVLANWYRQMQLHKEQEIAAVAVSTPRLLQGILSDWSEPSTEASKREKRKAAYTQVRRMVKMNLVRGILHNWRQQANRFLDLEDQANDVRQNKLVIFGMGIFDRWRARAEELAELEALSRENVLKRQFSIWRTRSNAYRALETEAILTFEENRQSRAFKKWNLALLQLRAQTNYAYDIREKNAKRTFRKMFTYWRQKAVQKRPPKAVKLSEIDNQLGVTARAEAWSDFGDGLEGDDWAKGLDEATTSTPIPGYLSTPSKRSERVMAVAARFSTTPKAPLSTPFERQLRAQSAVCLKFSQPRDSYCFASASRTCSGNGEQASKLAFVIPTRQNTSFTPPAVENEKAIGIFDRFSIASTNPAKLHCNATESIVMRAVLPGKPRAKLQAVCTGCWDSRRLIAYVTGNALVVLTGSDSILQTIYDDDEAELEAIAIDELSGKIATCAGSNVRVYKPYGQGEDALQWSLQHSFSIEELVDNLVTTISWGVAEELLVGGAWLTLFSTLDTPTVIWKKELANEVKFAHFSYDSAYIASTGKYDRLVKIWRRLSFGSDDTRFDFSYLPHPATVTSIHWRRPYHVDQTIDNVLYTICADNVLRIWAPTDPHGLQLLQLWGQIDLKESIQPRGLALGEASHVRFAFIIDGRDFTHATEHAVQSRAANGEKEDLALSHLIEVANRSPEICVVLDGLGNMSAWGLENVGCKVRQITNIFNIAHVDGLDVGLPSDLTDQSNYVQFYNYCNNDGGGLNLLIHHFDGKIEVFESNVADLFDPSPRSDRFVSKAVWTGHASTIRKIIRNVSGRAVVSRTDGNEGIVWRHMDLKDGTSVLRQSIILEKEYIHRICVMRKGSYVMYLHYDRIALWDTRDFGAKLLATCGYSVPGKPLCILMLPEVRKSGPIAHVATITSKMKGVVWEVQLPQRRGSTSEPNGYPLPSIREFCQFDLGVADDVSYVLPVDPAGSPPVISGFLDTFARDIAISYTHSGLLRSWTARVDLEARKVDWLETCSVDTGIHEPALASGSSIRKAALVNSTRSELTIWDVRGAQLEYSQDYESQDTIRDLDWTSTPDDQSILAVGFQFRVILLAQMRYDYLNKGPAWAAIREFNIRDLTPHPIGDSAWLGGGNLIIGAGNQLFVFDKAVDHTAPVVASLGLPRKNASLDLFNVVSRLNGPLPVYHPQFLGQCTLSGKSALVQKVLIALYKTLKYFVEGDFIDNHLGMELEDFYESSDSISTSAAANKISKSTLGNFTDEEDEVETVTEEVALAINEKLTKIALPQLSRQEQIHLADIVECVAIVEKQRRSMDDNAARFMLFFRQHALHRGRSNEVNLSWREINWAYHSNSQDILADVVSHQFHGKMLWEHARESGIFMWMTDSHALRAQFEIIARNEYTKSDMKNPVDCSLFYLALKKKAVLQGLWRMAAWNREQSATIRLLSNNFQDKKWKTAALKNAYALMGKHRHEYAAAFFLLADCLKDAVNVILNQLKDLQLAIAVTRVYEGERGPVLQELLQDKVLPLAAQEGNRWLASWAFWMLHRRDMSSPVYTLLETPQSPNIQSKLFLTDDPALIILYSQLRQKTLQTLRGASKITPKVEWAFVLHNARLYDRMGCDLLALDLVRNWEFLLPAPTIFRNLEQPDPRQMLRRRSSLVVADLPMPKLPLDMKSGGHKPPPSVFEEPESSSLLDSFGF
ncbi:hypothetical protein G7Y89_g9420 [Cudoniella acicularis]|uniref:Uncharacterized protein n=1 Tax=Cudoniella acicularis TaxID=354080 RepID=A0A8H4REP3_9HELO|nr:hypothetical protein G7Y89_g9420 [Cudoniella acicularis]